MARYWDKMGKFLPQARTMARPEVSGKKTGTAELHLGRKLRRRLFYTVPDAGRLLGWSRSESYRRAQSGDIPVETDGGLLLVPRKEWNRRVRRLLRGLRSAAQKNEGPGQYDDEQEAVCCQRRALTAISNSTS
jgi:hypothetical protein